MVPLSELWLPIVLSAVIVFFASSIINIFLPHHRTDYRSLPDEERARDEVRSWGLAPGDYAFPHASSPKEMSSDTFLEKQKQGPVGLLTILEPGPGNMGRSLLLWFILALFVSQLAAYVAGRTLPPGADYMTVFQITSTVAFASYVLAHWQHAIWYGRSWSTILKFSIDGFVYAFLTGGVFGWLWP